MRILVVNAGTSSVKLSVIVAGDAEATRELGAPDERVEQAVGAFAAGCHSLDAVAHRLVHGGPEFREAVLVDAAVRRRLDTVVELAPLHMPPALRLLDVVAERLDGVPRVACFDTAFHATLPEPAYTYALPEPWRALGVRRYGFHGLSCAWSLRRAAQLLRRPAESLHLLVAHLGSGASVTAVRDGRSVDTSMGLTPLEGLVMARRSGSVDPGALTWLQTVHGVGAAEVYAGLERESGVFGLAGSDDLREVERRADAGDAQARLALDVYVHRARACLASVAAALERVDALAFTGGVGEHSARIRANICAGLGVLGLPASLPEHDGADSLLSEAGASPAVLVVHAREDLEIAREAEHVLNRR